MPTDPQSFYSSAPLQQLFARELAALAPILGGVYGTTGLFLRAHANTPALLPAHLIGSVIDLALDGAGVLRGKVTCMPTELPLAGESCKLIIAQHVFERLDEPVACASELARVLAPEGVVLVLGFNPVGLWRPWLEGRSRGADIALRVQSAQRCQNVLSRQGVEILQTRYIGAWSPWQRPPQLDAAAGNARMSALGWLRGSWLLLARKRRSVLTPLRLRRSARELARSPRLAPGAHRECA
jgi:SAM-dependent methyltransferase